MKGNELFTKLDSINQEVSNFERSLRTSFRKEDPNNYIQIQRVNRECQLLEEKVRAILKLVLIRPSEKLKADSVISRAMFYINKFKQAIEQGITLDGDVLSKIGQQKTKG